MRFNIFRYDALPEYVKKNFESVQVLINKVDAVSANFYRRRRYEQAAVYYGKLSSMLNACVVVKYSNRIELNRLKSKTHLNMAIVYMKMKNYGTAMSHLNEASILCNYKTNCKYLFWRGKCHFMLNQHMEAFSFLTEAALLEPSNTEVGRMLAEVDKVLTKNRHTERNIAMKAISVKEIEEVTKRTLEHTNNVNKVREVRATMIESNIAELAMPVLRMLQQDLIVYQSIVRDIDDFEIVGRPSLFYANLTQYYFIIPSKR